MVIDIDPGKVCALKSINALLFHALLILAHHLAK
jgi:hypothetical protein